MEVIKRVEKVTGKFLLDVNEEAELSQTWWRYSEEQQPGPSD